MASWYPLLPQLLPGMFLMASCLPPQPLQYLPLIWVLLPEAFLEGAARLRLPHCGLPPQHLSAFFAVIPREARSEKRGGQPSPVLGADLAARRGCRITQGRNAAWSLSGWCLMYTGLLRKLNVWAQLLSSPPHGPRPRKMPLAKGTHSR